LAFSADDAPPRIDVYAQVHLRLYSSLGLLGDTTFAAVCFVPSQQFIKN
jgi:hypothetical protein